MKKIYEWYINDWKPIVIKGNLTAEKLHKILFIPYKKSWKHLFCFHNWVYWKFKDAHRRHRVCTKCYKKQQEDGVLVDNSNWIKDAYFD